MKFLILPLLIISFHANSQCKSSKVAANGETINCIDNNDKKQGKWSEKIESLRGEPGYDAEGSYKDGKKEGVWRLYTTMGDLFAIERYRWGNKDGVSQYYNIAGIVREESWKAVNPENPYDTVDVIDPIDPTKISRRVIKIEGTAVKHGTWKYYDSRTGGIEKTDKYFLNKLQDPNQMNLAEGGTAVSDSTNAKTVKAPAKTKPQAVLDFEKKNTGKKKVKYIDGKTF
jgi:hypothetical protein